MVIEKLILASGWEIFRLGRESYEGEKRMRTSRNPDRELGYFSRKLYGH